MKLHLFHFTPHGLARAYSHLVAGMRLCRKTGLRLRPLVPDSVNSMTAAYNVFKTFDTIGLPLPKTFIDVGANVSQMTRMLLGLAPQAQVLSFEPNANLTPIGTLYRTALSDTDGTADFCIPANDSNWGTIATDVTAISPTEKRYPVQTRRMESLIESGEIQWTERGLQSPIFVKIDTEGSERKVIDGFGKYMNDVTYLLVEVENQECRGNNYDLISLCTTLAEKGFNRSKVVYSCYDGPDAPAYSDILFWKDNRSSTLPTQYE